MAEATTAQDTALVSEAIPPAPEAVAVPPGTAPVAAPAAVTVREIKVIEDNGQRGVFVKLSGPPAGLSHFVLENPSRIVVDVAGAGASAPSAKRFAVSDAVIAQVRLAQHDASLRLTIELRGKSIPAYTVNDLNDTVIAFLGEPQGNAEPVREQVVFSQRPIELAQAAPEEAPPRSRPAAAARPAARVIEAEPTPRSSDPFERMGERRTYSGPHVSLDFKDADVHNVLRLLAEVSKLNIVATEDVKGKVTLRLFDVPWDQALDIILQVLSLESVQEGNVIRISTVSRLRAEREELRRAQEASRAVEPLRVEYIRINYAKAVKLADIVSGTARQGGGGRGGEGGILTSRGSVLVDEFTNTLIVRDVQRGIDNARELVRQLDVQTPQILIESNIVEATSDFARSLGVQWGYRASVGPQTGTTTGANFPGTIGVGGSGLGLGQLSVPFIADFPAGGNFGPGAGGALDLALGSLNGAHALDARITALQEKGKAKIVSRPRVVTLNNVPATIKSLTIIRVKLPSTGTVINTGAGGAAGSASTATEKIETGITLVVTPQVSSDGYILLDMFAKSSQADFTRTVDQIPTEISREANSHVLIKDGQTVVLGGIYRDQLNDQGRSIPFVSDIPGLSWLFSNATRSDRREDLLVFMTPRVLGSVHPSLPTAAELWEHRAEGALQ
ncbi:MAG: type IV pilus secretin PilQ [Deltaproteobacteria bacterium]|nr:type IV pilus secretin PilQ [Deltaproteobacteria bacterium]